MPKCWCETWSVTLLPVLVPPLLCYRLPERLLALVALALQLVLLVLLVLVLVLVLASAAL